jgi:hypothetical protein
MPLLPRLRWKAISIQKLGNLESENEDAFLPAGAGIHPAGEKEFIAVLADGATQTSFSGLWARLLVDEAYKCSYPTDCLGDVIQNARHQWTKDIARLDLPWHAEEKVKLGSFASLLWFGMKLSRRSTQSQGAWRAIGVGDTCLFQFRRNILIEAFPIRSSGELLKDPLLLSSHLAKNDAILNQGSYPILEGAWTTGDEFLLMTDALAGWFLRAYEKGTQPLTVIHTNFVNSDIDGDGYTRWLADLRYSKLIKNDDTTLVWIGIGNRISGVVCPL